MQQAAPDPIAGKFFRVAHLSLKEPRENDRGENSDYFSDAGAENVIAYRNRIGSDHSLRVQARPCRFDRNIERQQFRKMGKQRGVVLKDQAADIECISSMRPVDVIAPDMAVGVDDQDALIALLLEDRGGDQPRDACP
ncbi:hypothetical protein FHX12_002684 [Rhizobium sp. BK609]|nr:hypothetical protein [Rhizobium sp. BK098]MBB3615703.1 hypothetical protein [Rhizobium sp. BK609]